MKNSHKTDTKQMNKKVVLISTDGNDVVNTKSMISGAIGVKEKMTDGLIGGLNDAIKEDLASGSTGLVNDVVDVSAHNHNYSMNESNPSVIAVDACNNSTSLIISGLSHAEMSNGDLVSVLDGNSNSSMNENLNVSSDVNTHTIASDSGTNHANKELSSPVLNCQADNKVVQEAGKSSYMNVMVKNVEKLDNKMFYIPTEVTQEGKEIVVFDNDMVLNGSKHWKLTLCGFFVGYRMAYNEIRYHLRKMWGNMVYVIFL